MHVYIQILEHLSHMSPLFPQLAIQWNLSNKDTSFNQDAINDPSYIEKYTKPLK